MFYTNGLKTIISNNYIVFMQIKSIFEENSEYFHFIGFKFQNYAYINKTMPQIYSIGWS